LSEGVAKRATNRNTGLRPRAPFPRARDAFEAVMRAMGVSPADSVLLPAYVGWSPREGSGIHDPIAAVGATAKFVWVSRHLEVDLDHFRRGLAEGPRLVLLVHYFGRPDPGSAEMAALAREAGVPVLEDEAHALFTDLVGGATGRLGDAVIFSLHKQLACEVGGELRVKAGAPEPFFMALEAGQQLEGALDPSDYDLAQLAQRRLENAQMLAEALAEHCPGVTPLWPCIEEGVIPQTFPVIIEHADRDRLYERFNAAGWGGTSLYHTMIPEITPADFPDSHWLARRIFNLPIHQDVEPEQMIPMAKALRELL